MAAKIDWKGAIAVRRTLFRRQKLTLTIKRSSTSAHTQLSSHSGMLTIKKSFKIGVYENETKLTKYVLWPKAQKHCFRITWEIFKRAQPIADGNNPVYRLYLKKSTAFVYAFQKEGCLNQRNEFISSCWLMKNLFLKHHKF